MTRCSHLRRAITYDKISSEVTSIEDNEEDCEDIYYCEDLIQLPTKYEGCRLWQFCKNAPSMMLMLEMRCQGKSIFKAIWHFNAQRQKARTDFFVHNEHKL